MTIRKIRLTGRLVGLLALAVLLALAIASPTRAQETPEPTAEPTPEDTTDEAGPSVAVSPPVRLAQVGEEFVVEVLAEDVEQLAGFAFTITYDPEQVSYQRAEELGTLLDSSERGDVTCDDPVVDDGTVAFSCETGGQPVCAGGASGASGSGLLVRLFFNSSSAGEAKFDLVATALVSDDVEPCGQVIGDEIAHGTDPSTVMITREGHTVQEEPALVKIDAPIEPIEAGEEFAVELLVENVEHLAAFDFAISYDPELMSYERVEDAGQFLATGERQNISCPDAIATDGKLSLFCVTRVLGAYCVGAPAGASGSGLLARVFFKARGEGVAMLTLSDATTTLVLDDYSPCDLNFTVPKIPHTLQGASVELLGGDGLPWLILGPAIGVVALLVIGGGIGLSMRRRGGDAAP